jgi:hypothetical protein
VLLTRWVVVSCAAPEFDPQRSGELLALHEAVGMIVEEEEELLTEHMQALQEHAELLTEEGKLLSAVQGSAVVDYDVDAYASRLATVSGSCPCSRPPLSRHRRVMVPVGSTAVVHRHPAVFSLARRALRRRF